VFIKIKRKNNLTVVRDGVLTEGGEEIKPLPKIFKKNTFITIRIFLVDNNEKKTKIFLNFHTYYDALIKNE